MFKFTRKLILLFIILFTSDIACACQWEINILNIDTGAIQKYTLLKNKPLQIKLQHEGKELTCGAEIIDEDLARGNITEYHEASFYCIFAGTSKIAGAFETRAGKTIYRHGHYETFPSKAYIWNVEKFTKMFRIFVSCN
jgi:hypothetical protein